MTSILWRVIARILSCPPIADCLIRRAQRTPYENLSSADGQERYMGRWWLFNPYDSATHLPRYRWFPWSIRLHHIVHADFGPYLHDHPWPARSIILRGGYVEKRLREQHDPLLADIELPLWAYTPEYRERTAGTTAVLRPGQFHRIDWVSPEGAFTLFITGRRRGDWGFLVQGAKVPAHEHLKRRPH